MKTMDVAVATITCHQGCGLTFQVPEWWESKRRQDHTWWYCPNGHTQHFSGETEAERLKREKTDLEKKLAGKDLDLQYTRNRLAHEEARVVGHKGAMTKMKKRIAAGCCPICRRNFRALARHIAGQHPHFRPGSKQKRVLP